MSPHERPPGNHPGAEQSDPPPPPRRVMGVNLPPLPVHKPTRWWHSSEETIKVFKAVFYLVAGLGIGGVSNALATKGTAKSEDVEHAATALQATLQEQLNRIEVRQLLDQEQLRTVSGRQKYTNSYLAKINHGPLTANFDYDTNQQWLGPPSGNLEPTWASDRVYPTARDATLFITEECLSFDVTCDPNKLPSGARRDPPGVRR